MAQLLSAVAPGTLVQLNESGRPVEFYVAAHHYESGLNGPGRTLLVRKNAIGTSIKFSNNNSNSYIGSVLQRFSSSYINRLEPWAITAAGTTKFYYSPGNGNYTTAVLEKASFDLSVTELGYSPQYSVSLGKTLSASGSLDPVFADNGTNVSSWTRTPRTQNYSGTQCAFISGGAFGQVMASAYCRPCFTLPGTLYVWDDSTVSQYIGPAPTHITTPALIMQGDSIPISWDGVSGADSYILQRKADSGEWEQIYSGSDTTFTDTAGAWSTVQYQVCGVFGGTNGAFAQSDVITVLPASALVISGTDGDLGTINSDIPYSVATDTGNPVTLVRTVNGAQVATATVQNGFSYNIPVMGLPTGTGTIVITATVQTSSDPVTVTRTWTYTKQAQTFPGAGGVAQLSKDGQNVFPLTLAEAVKAIGGPWGGNLSTALDKLAKAATYTTAGDFADLWGNIIPTVKIETGSYVGTGTHGSSNPNKLVFSGRPLLVFVYTATYFPTIITNSSSVNFIAGFQWAKGITEARAGAGIDNGTIHFEEDGKSLSWYHTTSEDSQANNSGTSYFYLAFIF